MIVRKATYLCQPKQVHPPFEIFRFIELNLPADPEPPVID